MDRCRSTYQISLLVLYFDTMTNVRSTEIFRVGNLISAKVPYSEKFKILIVTSRLNMYNVWKYMLTCEASELLLFFFYSVF